MNNKLWLGIGLFIIGIVLVFIKGNPSVAPVSPPGGKGSIPLYGLERVSIRGHEFNLEKVYREEDRAKGLSGRDGLPQDAAMFFAFDTPGRYGFWMKDMKFPIDIIWVQGDWREDEGKIVYIKNNATLESYPESFAPAEPASYVLEINAGLAEKYGMKAGDMVRFLKLK